MLNRDKFVTIIWIVIVSALVMSFPLQVLMGSPVPSVLPYVGISLLIILRWTDRRQKFSFRWNIRKPLVFLISVYLFFVFFHAVWQVSLGFISIGSSISSIFIYAFPIIFYLYFMDMATDNEIRTVLGTIALLGFIVALYFAVDSYLRFGLRLVSPYAKAAFMYSMTRSGEVIANDDFSLWMALQAERSYGLLEKHSVSATWSAFGCFAALSLVPQASVLRRMMIIIAYGFPLIIGMNFTGILVFFVVMGVMEFRVLSVLVGRISKKTVRSALIVGVLVLICISVFFTVFDKGFARILQFKYGNQIELITGREIIHEEGQSFSQEMLTRMLYVPHEFPLGVLTGQGFTGVWRELGGDYGLSETLYRLGWPLFIAVLIGFLRIVFRSFKLISRGNWGQSRNLWFALCVLMYVLFMDVHYSVWSAKSVFPIFCMALAICVRSIQSSRKPANSSS